MTNIPLSDKVCELIEKLGGTFVLKKPRLYRYTSIIPRNIQYFIDVNFRNCVFESEKYGLCHVQFEKEFKIVEESDYKWFAQNQDFVMFGDGTAMICAKQDECQDSFDFNIYLIYDEKNRIEGPIKISEFLESLIAV